MILVEWPLSKFFFLKRKYYEAKFYYLFVNIRFTLTFSLFGLLWIVVIIGFVGIFIPFSTTFDLFVAIGTAILFCGFIIYDTHNIMNRLSPEEYITASVDLYLDFINLFLSILRILNDLNRD
jgi:FtsH-binding integral membrane protein